MDGCSRGGGAVASTAPIELREREGRDALLVVAAEPLRDVLAERGRSNRFDVHVCTTPLAACVALARLGARIAYALISSDPPWGLQLRQLLAEEHPDIKVVMLVG